MPAAKVWKQESMAMQINVADEQALYLDAAAPASALEVLVNGAKLQIPDSSLTESPHRLIYLGSFKDTEVTLQVLDQNGQPYPADAMMLGILDLKAWKEWGAQQKNVLQTAVSDNKGRIDVSGMSSEQESTLFLPVAAIDGWSCRADRQMVDITPIFGGFMGITLPKKTEVLELTFSPPGLRTGCAFSLAAVLILAGSLLLTGRRKAAEESRPAAGSRRLYTFLAACYAIIWIAGFLMIYVIPNIGLVIFMICKVLF